MPPKTLKPTKNSRAVKALENLFKTGQVCGTENPAEFYAMHESFKSHNYRNFADKYRKMREELADPDESTGDLDTHCTNAIVDGGGKRRRMDITEEEEEEIDETQPGAELVLDRKAFKPLCLLSKWFEPITMIKRVTAAVMLPAGAAAHEYTARIVDGGSVLEVSVQWPEALLNVERMHRKWLRSGEAEKMQLYHPEILGFQTALKFYRKRVGEVVRSTARVALPFPVESHIYEKHNLSWYEGSERMVYIRLRAAVDDYALQSDKQDFEIV